jgi:hypothetical protein
MIATINQSINQLIDQLIDQPVDQPVDQPIDQPGVEMSRNRPLIINRAFVGSIVVDAAVDV